MQSLTTWPCTVTVYGIIFKLHSYKKDLKGRHDSGHETFNK